MLYLCSLTLQSRKRLVRLRFVAKHTDGKVRKSTTGLMHRIIFVFDFLPKSIQNLLWSTFKEYKVVVFLNSFKEYTFKAISLNFTYICQVYDGFRTATGSKIAIQIWNGFFD